MTHEPTPRPDPLIINPEDDTCGGPGAWAFIFAFAIALIGLASAYIGWAVMAAVIHYLQ